MELRPTRGGFLRPFGCGWFIREFLLGQGPNGSPKIDPAVGAPQADIFYDYKRALLKAIVLDKATRKEERQALGDKDRMYLQRFRQREQKGYFDRYFLPPKPNICGLRIIGS